MGFDFPDEWVAYAAEHAFSAVKATRVEECPDCAGSSRSEWGQYVYYSTLMRLQQCSGCGLVYSDVHLDPAIVRQHFEQAYKDEGYFLAGRTSIFEDIAGLTAPSLPI